jgi:serine/threonine-protein kinase
VPNVVGSTISVAKQRLRGESFDVSVIRDTSDKPRNTVVEQAPGAGTTADRGSTVRLNISDGPPLQKVPDVVRQGRRAARRILTAAGFGVQDARVASDTVRIDHVISQAPAAGSQAERGASVRLQVSAGPEQVPVPDIVGKTEDEARTALENAGLHVTVVPTDDAKKAPGTVLAQSPGSGAVTARGSVVTIDVAQQPTQVTVPGVVGRTQNEATATLSGAGLKVEVKDTPVDTPDKDGIVQTQSEDPNTKVKRGSAVTISVGVFDPALNPDPGATTTPTTPTTPTTTPAPPPPAAK